ncbi:MAG: DNA-3-methyladenine glycosylase [Opitutales bacterium]|jgi:DNA-3-methyladenine glycosylase
MKGTAIESIWHKPARVVAPALLGRMLCRRLEDGTVLRLVITEAEAYCGPHDGASHAARGATARNRVMFGPPGVWYVYLCYGVHWMLNLVTGAEGYPAAVLLRGAVDLSVPDSTVRAQGPGRLTRALAVGRAFNGLKCAPSSGLWIEGCAGVPPGWRRRRGPRIGVDYAGPRWIAMPYRWWLERKRTARG